MRRPVGEVAAHLVVDSDAVRGGVQGDAVQGDAVQDGEGADRVGRPLDPQDVGAQCRGHLPIPTVMPWMIRVPSQEKSAIIGARMMQTPANIVP